MTHDRSAANKPLTRPSTTPLVTRLRTDSPPCLVRPVRTSPAAWQLVCFPYAGGSAAIYHDWPRRLPADVELIAVELPGRGRRFSEAPQGDLADLLEEVVPALAQAIHGSYVLFGHSMGALLAYETALSLTRRLRRGPALLALSASRAPDVVLRRPPVHDLATPELKASLRRLGGTPAAILGDEDTFSLFEPALRADFRLVETYFRRNPTRVDAPLLVLGATDDEHVELADTQRWAAIGADAPRFHHCAGGHFFMNDAANRIAELVASTAIDLMTKKDASQAWRENHAY